MKKIYAFIENGKRVDVTARDITAAIQKAQVMLGTGKMVVLVNDDPSGKYQCGTCNMYVPETNECTNVLGRIEPHGTCQLRHSGANAKPKQINPFRLLKAEAGYDERNEGFGCIRCIRFQAPSVCKIIKDEVNWNKCCNYQYDGNVMKSGAIQRKYEKEQDKAEKERLATTGGDRTELEQKVRKVKKALLDKKDSIQKNKGVDQHGQI